MRLGSRIGWFALAGGLGFLVDAGVLKALIWTGLDPRPARLVSFLAALATTWIVNRSAAFRDRAGPPSLAEFGRYAAASAAAGAVNLGVYFGLVTAVPVFAAWPVAALAVATAASMSLNFWSYFRLVFARPG